VAGVGRIFFKVPSDFATPSACFISEALRKGGCEAAVWPGLSLNPANVNSLSVGAVSSSSPANVSSLSVAALSSGSGVALSVTNAQGQVAGINPSTGQVQTQIPQSAAYVDSPEFDPGGNTQSSTDIFQPAAGQYSINVTSPTTQTFTLYVRTVSPSGSVPPPQIFQGTAGPGAPANFTVQYGSPPPPPVTPTPTPTPTNSNSAFYDLLFELLILYYIETYG
jgi:hypothetical protein